MRIVVIILVALMKIILTEQEQEEEQPRSHDDRYYTSEMLDKNDFCVAHEAKFTCDCHNRLQHVIVPQLEGAIFQIEIMNCGSVAVNATAFERTMGLRRILFKNINNLTLNTNSLNIPRHTSNAPIIIEFHEVNFEVIESNAINGNIEEITFTGGRIDVIQPFGFTTLKDRAELFKLDRVHIRRIEPQAFKKFTIEKMEITSCTFEAALPSKAFYELEALEIVRINNVTFRDVQSRAFSFKLASKLVLTNNRFDGIDGEWLEAQVRDNIIIRANHFGLTSPISFRGLTVHRDYVGSEKLELRFLNNTVRASSSATTTTTATHLRPLVFDASIRLVIDQLRYENEYRCSDAVTDAEPPRPRHSFFEMNADKILFVTTTTTTTTRNHHHHHYSYRTLSKILEEDCQPSQLFWWFVISGIIVAIVFITIATIVVWCRRRRTRSGRRRSNKLDNMVVPEPRTYKETQILYQIEDAGILRTDM